MMKRFFTLILIITVALSLLSCGEAELSLGSYTYEGEGFGGDFTISLNEDGVATYYEGMLSSILGIGTWEVEDGILTLSEYSESIAVSYESPTPLRQNRFKIGDERLVFIEDGSDNFTYVQLKDGERFSFTGIGELQEENKAIITAEVAE